MGSRLYVAGIVLVWLAAMSWLVTERILPPFFRGEPPRAGLSQQLTPVAWQIEIDGKACGTAVLQAVDGDHGVREVLSLVTLENLPWPKSAPIWMAPLKTSIRSLSLKMRSRLGIDSLGKLREFDTRLWVNATDSPVRLRGRVHSGKLKLMVRAAELTRDFEHPWPADGMLAGELMPETKLLHIYPGKRWQKEVYSPFASPTQPIELIEASVAPEERIHFQGKLLRVRPVEYRSQDRTGLSDKERLRTRLLVAEDGRVLRQDAYFLGSRLTFTRLSDEASLQVAAEQLDLDTYATSRTPHWEPEVDTAEVTSPEPAGAAQNQDGSYPFSPDAVP